VHRAERLVFPKRLAIGVVDAEEDSSQHDEAEAERDRSRA
jgi:hypothetical protein